MSNIDITGRLFEKNLRNIISNIVWKDQFKAQISEESHNVDRIYTDKYTSAARKLLEYYSYNELISFSYYSQTKLLALCNTVSPAVSTLLQSFYNYEEKNDYYRMLAGLPPYNCEDKYILTLPIDNQWGISPTIPIHTLDRNTLLIVENDGGLDLFKSLTTKDPVFNYVNHLTNKRIIPFVARLAKRFDLVYVPASSIPSISTDFKIVYDECRDFLVYRYYTESMRTQYQYYEGFFAMSILFMAIQRMHVKYLEADVTRDFYDLDSIKIVYDAYSIPFFDDIPTSYHQMVVKWINRLLSYKGSNQVFFDLCSLFDYSTLKIFQYYILKKHRFIDGKPVFSFDSNGKPKYREMFDVSFIQGTIGGDPFLEVTDSNNELNYDGVTAADPYWLNDQDLLDKLYETEYNFIETKYIGLQMVYSTTKFLFESGYFVSLLLSNRDKVSRITVGHGKLGYDVDLFTLIIYIYSLICIKLGYEGNIPTEPSKIGRIMGFNFKDDLTQIQKDIKNNPFIIDSEEAEITQLLSEMIISDFLSVGKVFSNIKQLYQLIDDRLISTHNVDVYYAYKHLYQILLTTEYLNSTFTKRNGEIAESYMDLLMDIEPSLAIRIQLMSSAEITSELQYSLIALQKVSDQLSYIQNFGNASGEVVADYLYKLIRLFKSAKAELIDYNIVYIVDGRSTNILKLLSKLIAGKRISELEGDELELFDYINKVTHSSKVLETMLPKDILVIMEKYIYISDDLTLKDTINGKIINETALKDLFEIYDDYKLIQRIGKCNDKITMTEYLQPLNPDMKNITIKY